MRTLVSRAVRLPLRAVPAAARMPMVAPRELRGFRWLVGAGVHGCWLGTYERAKRSAFVDALHPGAVVYDVGAQAGYYTLLASRLVGPAGHVVAIEPLPRNVANLRRHVQLNHVRNVEVVVAAAAAHAGTGRFASESTSYMGHLDEVGDMAVDVVTIDEICASTGLRPDVLKIDVEGGEAGVLSGASRVLAEEGPVVFLATHGQVPHDDSCRLLREAGYELRPLDTSTLDGAREVLARRTGHQTGPRPPSGG